MTRRATFTTIAIGVACSPILCCWILVASCCCPRRLRPSQNSDDKKRFERRQQLAPRPLPVRPPSRALTIPRHGDDASIKHRGKTLDQSQSRLMQLPYELRQMIWEAVLGNGTLHMQLKKHKLGYTRCTASTAASPPGNPGTASLCPLEAAHGSGCESTCTPSKELTDTPTDNDILPLLLTCRQIYTESLAPLYTTNTFTFTDLDCLRYFSSTILPHRWLSIRSLALTWTLTWPIYDAPAQRLLTAQPALYPPHDEASWEATWRIVAKLPDLRRLRVRLRYYDGFRDDGCEGRLLEALKGVRVVGGREGFEVWVSWAGEEVRDAPFRIVRPEGRREGWGFWW